MGTDERANGVAQTGDRAAAAALAVCFAAYLWLYLPIVPGFGSMYADDYGMHFPNLLAGYFHLLANGPLSVPWFNPAQCAGVPFLADLNVAFYSLPQLLTVFVDPANAVRATFVVAAALGAAGFHLLLRSRFAASPWAAATGAVLFLFNGFFVVRMAIGHLTFHPVMLTPWLAWAALLPATTASRWTWRRGVLATVLVGAVFAYQFQAGMQHIVVPLVLASGVIVLVHGHLKGHAWQPWAILGLGAVLSVGLSAQRLAAAIAFVETFPRTLYPLPGFLYPTDPVVSAVLALFWHPPSARSMDALVNYRLILDWHEWAYGIGPAALALLIAGGAVLVGRTLVARTWRRPLSGSAVLVAIVLTAAIPIALNLYSPGWNAFLKSLPVLGQSVSLVRWFVMFILLAVLGAALAVDRLARSRLWAGGLFLLVAIATVWWSTAEPLPVSRGYNGAPIASARQKAAVDGVPPITEVRGELQTAAVQSYADRNNAMVDGMSEVICYQPMFGYRLEVFPAGNLRIGSILTPTAGDRLNFKNPACYLFPGENGCVPGDEFRADQRSELLQFAAYRAYPFTRSATQTTADRINLAALIASLLAVLAALAWRPRRQRAGDLPTA